ncbi:MAG: alpha-galactosidase [Clostridia bacterium]|nr:alpha-galactosidase [Clostridia bacterium]
MDFLKNNKRFSFLHGGKNIWDTEYKTEISEKDDALSAEYYFDGGLKITNIAKKYEKYDAWEWINYIENISDKPTAIISELWDCNVTLPVEHENHKKWEAYFPDAKTATKIYAPTGSIWTTDEFYCDADALKGNTRINHIYPCETKSYSASGGRSSEDNAPFFNVYKNGKGYIFAIGWTGQWNCQIERGEDDITFKSKIEDTHFRVMPGEKFRTSSVVVMAYEGDVVSSHNKWRRLVKEHFSLMGTDGRDKYGPLCAGIWGGMKSESVLERIKSIKKHNLPFEYIWMDAGWYGADAKPSPDEFEGDWSCHVGDWQISPNIHPKELSDVSKAIEDSGMKFLLWFEPERVIYSTSTAMEHPEYFLSCNTETDVRLLNFGSPEAWEYCFNTISDIIEKLNISCYRQDFNFSPLECWRKNDGFDRQGITEIKHINGLYAFWDALLERFPNLIIDNCASGGRRIDIETLRRSIPLWRSDYQCPANYDVHASQCHHMTYNTWLPYSGSGTGREYDEYRIRSSYDSSLTTNYSFSEREAFCDTQEKIEFIKKYTNEYLKLRPYFSEDFYPLTHFSDKPDTWVAMQFDRPSQNDGIVQIFRREESPYEEASFKLGGIDANFDYSFEDIDGGEFAVSGAELLKKGFSVRIPEKRCAKIYLYKKVK